MMQNPQTTPAAKRRAIPVKTLAYSALLTALSVVLARWVIPMPNAFTRFSIEAVPIFLAGSLFGPLVGGMVGFAADFIGCLFSGYGYNPLFCLPPILYGISGGLFQPLLVKKVSLPRLALAFLPPVVLGSILWQSTTLAYVYNSKGSFQASLVYFLTSRSVQFAVTLAAEVIVVWLLFKTQVFDRIGIWPPKKKEKKKDQKA